MLAHTLLSQLMPNNSHTIHRHRVQRSDCDWDAMTFRPAEVSKTATSSLPARARFHSIDSQTLGMPSHSRQQDPCSMLTCAQQHTLMRCFAILQLPALEGDKQMLSQCISTAGSWGSSGGCLLKLSLGREPGTEHELSFHPAPLQHTYPCPTCTLYVKPVGNTLKNTGEVLAALWNVLILIK